MCCVVVILGWYLHIFIRSDSEINRLYNTEYNHHTTIYINSELIWRLWDQQSIQMRSLSEIDGWLAKACFAEEAKDTDPFIDIGYEDFRFKVNDTYKTSHVKFAIQYGSELLK